MQFLHDILSEQSAQLLFIFCIFIITWWKSVYGTWNIDDDQGIAPFSERYDPTTDKIIDSYKDGEKEHKFLSYQKHLGFPGAFMRWHRLQIGKKYTLIGKNKKGHEHRNRF